MKIHSDVVKMQLLIYYLLIHLAFSVFLRNENLFVKINWKKNEEITF